MLSTCMGSCRWYSLISCFSCDLYGPTENKKKATKGGPGIQTHDQNVDFYQQEVSSSSRGLQGPGPRAGIRPDSTNNIRVQVQSGRTYNMWVWTCFKFYKMLHTIFWAFSGHLFSKEKLICIRIQLMEQSEDLSTQQSGNICVANKDSTWTTNA
jgi:hypothetical protein